MRPVLLDEITSVYTCMEQARTTLHRIHHAPFYEFTKLVNLFEQTLGESRRDTYWEPIVRSVRRYRFQVCASPCDINVSARDTFAHLQARLATVQFVFPQYSKVTGLVLSSLEALANLSDNPILDVIRDLCKAGGYKNGVLLLKESWLVSATEQILAAASLPCSLRVATHFQLRNTAQYDVIFPIGSSRWFPPYVFTAPRAPNIHIAGYAWIASSWKAEPAFAGTLYRKRPPRPTRYRVQEIVVGEMASGEPVEDFSSAVLSSVPVSEILAQISWNDHDGDAHDQDDAEAKLYVLAGEMAVFLEATREANALILDPDGLVGEDEDGSTGIKRVKTKDLRPGVFILLRTSGGGDYIVPIADRILGRQATKVRALQQEWKMYLRQAVQRLGFRTAVRQLCNRGSVRANEQNLGNWMSSRSIRPRSNKDFRAILALIGLKDREQEFFAAADAIETAHHKAGFRIRKLLLEQVATADSDELHRAGQLNFQLPAAAGGSLTAFRIESISQEVVAVPASRLSRVFGIEGSSSWHG